MFIILYITPAVTAVQHMRTKWEMRNIFVQKRKCLCDGTPSLAVLVRYTHHFGDHYWMILGKNLGMTPPYIGIGQYTSIYGYYLNNHIWGTISGVNPTTRQLLIYLSTLKYLTIRSNLNPMCISDQYCNLFSGKQLPLCGYNTGWSKFCAPLQQKNLEDLIWNRWLSIKIYSI